MTRKLAPMGYLLCFALVFLSLAAVGCQKKQSPPPQAAAPAASPAQPVPAQAPVAPAAATSNDPGVIQMGMTSEQVQQIMGAPAKTEQEGSMVEWKYYTQTGKVEIKLQNNKVVAIERH